MKKEYKKQMDAFKRNVRLMSHEELMDLLGYIFMRTAELEMLFMVLKGKGIIKAKDFNKYRNKFKQKVNSKFKVLEKRAKFNLST